ncbi:DNA replication and repair protein RecF, partial [Candidatus Marinimicrobia bacterium]|nr:DNA replication and repair protein RecF [Candidatus Neomarinimicrobiota bacterium]
MEINKLEMISFRNHKKTNINFNPGLTIIWGENGSGKTSILEAIHSLSYGKSFRTNNKTDLIKKGDKNFFIKGFFKNKDSSKNSVTLSQDTTGLKKITINKKPIKKRKELLGLNNVVIFSPEEEEITKGSPVSRRNYFDKIFSICSYSYLNELLSYNKILKQRNSLLRTEKNINKKQNELEIWNEPLVQ